MKTKNKSNPIILLGTRIKPQWEKINEQRRTTKTTAKHNKMTMIHTLNVNGINDLIKRHRVGIPWWSSG